MALTPIGLIRKIGRFIRGGVTPSQAMLGCVLGVLLGMVPGFNLTLLAVILLLVVLNANGGLAVIGFAGGKVLCILLAPVTFRIGYFLIHEAGLEGLFRAAADTPVVALMDLHYYCLAGSLPIALAVGIVYGAAAGRMINGLRKAVLAAGEKSDRARKVAQSAPARLMMRLVFGKQKGEMANLLGAKSPLFRKAGIIVCLVLVGLVVAGQFLLVDVFFKDALRAGMEAAIGAEVNIDQADLSLFGGRLALRGLQVTDPEKPTHNLVQIASLSGDVSFRGLLTKRVVIDELAVADVATDAPRDEPGEVYKRPPPPEPKLPDDALSEYFEKADQLREYLQKLKEYLEDNDANEPEEAEPTEEDVEREKQRLRELAEAQGYFRLSAQRILSEHPSWVIRRLDVQGVRVENIEGPLRIEGRQLSDAPQLHDEPLELVVTEGTKTLASTKMDFARPGGEHRLAVHSPPLPLGEAFRLSDKSGIDVTDGTAQIDVDDGAFTNRRLTEFPFRLVLRDLKASTKDGRGVLGLDAETSREALKHLSEMKIAGTLTGPVAAPRLRLDEKSMLTALKDALVKAGKAELARRADQQLQKVTAQLTEKVGGEVGKTVTGAAGGVLGKVLPGLGPKKTPDANQPTKPEDKKKPGGGLLDSLLK